MENRPKRMEKNELSAVRSNILTYCAGMPQGIVREGPLGIAHFAASLGNCLIWVAPHLNGRDALQIEQPISETAESIYALGKQLRVAALELWGAKVEMDRGTEIALLRAEVARLDQLVHRLAAGQGRRSQ
jgi:hypothetical protein